MAYFIRNLRRISILVAMSRFNFIKKYIRYYLKSSNEHSVHSPFVFDLVTKVLYNKEQYYCFPSIEKLRAQLKADNSSVDVLDLGAGTLSKNTVARKVNQIVSTSVKPAKQAQLLFRLVNYFQPQTVLELGTSLGITTLYLANAVKTAQLITIEGSPEIAKKAGQNFEKFKIKNVEQIIGNIDLELTPAIVKLGKLDFVFFDGNHRKQATINYFEQCLKRAHNESVFVFDDIHWSDEMEEAWEYIKQHKEVTCTIDLFFMGLVFFRKEQAKEHFVIRY